MHASDSLSLVVLGLLLLGGYVAHAAADRASIPKVTILLVAGAVSGPAGLDLVPDPVRDWFPFVSQLALAMVAFLLGESFAGKHLAQTGRTAFAVSVAKALLAAVLVMLAVRTAGGSWPLALLLAGIAPATAPAAIFETVREVRAAGPLTDTLLEVVAIDDAWGIVLVSVLLVAAGGIAGGDVSAAEQVKDGLWQVGGALGLGALLALPMAWVTGRVRGGEATLVEAGGFVFLCAGLAGMLGVSYLLATMTLGATLANKSADARRPFHAIERVREPFLAVFFILAGLELDLGALTTLGGVGMAYVVARPLGFFAGTWLAARAVDAEDTVRRHLGWCLLPQAGVALGLALHAEQRLPQLQGTLLPLVVATTVLFELAGPIVVRLQLAAAGEAGRGPEED